MSLYWLGRDHGIHHAFWRVHQRTTTYDYARVNLLAQFVSSICINESNSIEYTPAHRYRNRTPWCVVNYSAAYALISPVKPELLTIRHREVFDLIVVGQSNTNIAADLGLSASPVQI